MHAVDPGAALARALRDDNASLRARALRVAGRCGRRDLIDTCLEAIADDDERCAFEAARSALLLGDRTESLMALEALAVGQGGIKPPNLAALRVALKVVSPRRAQAMLARLATDPAQIRTLIRGIAAAGDPHHVPWVIAQMDDPKASRLAGESFSTITGLDLAYLDLDRKPPENFEAGPNDDPADRDVAMDPDDGLPWPDPERAQRWWSANQARFVAGARYFMGESISPDLCVRVLKEGFQRQRIAAAEYLCLLQPGMPLFNTAAPAWRQQRLLATMK
jgi:uncharacterized protein (TIGR02270 family)